MRSIMRVYVMAISAGRPAVRPAIHIFPENMLKFLEKS